MKYSHRTLVDILVKLELAQRLTFLTAGRGRSRASLADIPPNQIIHMIRSQRIRAHDGCIYFVSVYNAPDGEIYMAMQRLKLDAVGMRR